MKKQRSGATGQFSDPDAGSVRVTRFGITPRQHKLRLIGARRGPGVPRKLRGFGKPKLNITDIIGRCGVEFA